MALRVACVGSGYIAGTHLNNMSRLDDVEVVGVASRNAQRVGALARRFGAAPYTDPVAMLDASRPDVLLVCVTPDAHGAIERAAIERKIPFLIEKPLAAEWDTAAEIAREIERAGLLVSVGYHWRYNTSVERAKEVLAGRRVAMAQGFWLDRTPPPAWWSRREQSGGQMVEQTTHIFDTARALLGEPASVYAVAARVERPAHPHSDVDEVSTATVQFANGAVATFNSTCILNTFQYRVGIDLFCDGLAVEVTADALVTDTGQERTHFRALGHGESIAREGRAFLEAARASNPSLVRSTYADALRTHRLTTLARESARLRRPLEIPSSLL